jgi:CheY-like chemotaxis protein
LSRTFEPLANDKGLQFKVEVAPGSPEELETDSQRLEQVLKNLLSNAFKFTEKGEVRLEVAPAGAGFISFAVHDTGIGIAEDQHEMVFEAFRQADGTTNRKYGGTGLGLSISRELAGLLGGRITLSSEAGQGSTFTVTIPTVLNAPVVKEPPRDEDPVPPRSRPAATASTPQMPDDRDKLTGKERVILVVEDDERFARILYDLAHEQGFECLIANNAEAALALAAEYVPSAVLLDIGLPDHSGLSVLDRLKREGRTRHIPVHVISGVDYRRLYVETGEAGRTGPRLRGA